MQKQSYTKKIVLMAMLAAVAYMMVAFIRIPAVLFLNYEPKDVIITIAGFLLGPFASFVISLVVALVEMFTISDTGPIGCLMNLLSSACFSCIAALIYQKKRSIGGAVLGLAVGSVAMVATMLLWNWLITPLYMTGTSREDVAQMLVPFFLPFNALKAGLNSALTLLLYKPLVSALRKAGLAPAQLHKGASAKWVVYVLGGSLLLVCVLVLLILRDVI